MNVDVYVTVEGNDAQASSSNFNALVLDQS